MVIRLPFKDLSEVFEICHFAELSLFCWSYFQGFVLGNLMVFQKARAH